MKWSPTGWGVEIASDTAKHGSYIIPVERWSRWTRRALVADPKTSRLIPATRVPGYKELVPLHRTVAVVPAAPGWKISARAFGGAAPYTTPIAAWVMDGEGDFWPVAAHGNNDAGPSNPDPKGGVTLRPHLSSRCRIQGPGHE